MTSVGITAYGAYLPKRRLNRAAIAAANAWMNPALKGMGKGSKAICNWDEDTVTMAVEGGQLQLNAFEPVIAHSIFQSITWMRRGMHTLRVNCVEGITANRERAREYAESSPSVVTPLNKYIGYEEAAKVAKKALAERKTIRQVVLDGGYVERGDLTAEQLDEALDVLRMTHP